MQFRIRIPTQSTNISLEAKSSGETWKEALSHVLKELNRSTDSLDRMQAHTRDDGRIIVEDPETLRIFELRPATVEAAPEPEPVPEPVPEPEPEPEPEPVPVPEMFPIKDRRSKLVDGKPSVILHMDEEEARLLNAEPLPIVVIPPDKIPGTSPSIPTAQDEALNKEKSRFAAEKEDQNQIATRLDLPKHPTPTPGVLDATEAPPIAPVKVRKTTPEHPVAKQASDVASSDFPDLIKGRSLAMVAGTFLRSIRDHVDANAGVILTPDGRKRHVIIAAAFGLPVSFKARRFKFGDGVGGFACEFDSALHIDDLAQRPDLSGELEEAITDISSVVASPVRTRSKTHGAVELIRTDGRKFSEEEYALIQAICEAQAQKLG